MAKRKRLIILVCLISILPMKGILGQAEREGGKRNPIFRKRKLPSFNRLPYDRSRPTELQWINPFTSKEDQRQYAPDEIIIKFKVPLSDFELANLEEFQLKDTEGLPAAWEGIEKLSDNRYRIRIPENCSVEGIAQMFERNPLVEYAEPNHYFRIAGRIHAADNKTEFISKEKICAYRDSDGRLVMTNYSRFKRSANKK